MSTDDNKVVDEWLSRLNELQPADGKLTDEIIAKVGPFPVYRPPGDAYDHRNSPKKSSQYHTGSVARVYALERAKFRVQTATSNSVRSTGDKAEEYGINARYWTEIVAWLRTIQ